MSQAQQSHHFLWTPEINKSRWISWKVVSIRGNKYIKRGWVKICLWPFHWSIYLSTYIPFFISSIQLFEVTVWVPKRVLTAKWSICSPPRRLGKSHLRRVGCRVVQHDTTWYNYIVHNIDNDLAWHFLKPSFYKYTNEAYWWLCIWSTYLGRTPSPEPGVSIFKAWRRSDLARWPGWWLTNHLEKYESQLGWWNSQYMEKKHVPNHQSVTDSWLCWRKVLTCLDNSQQQNPWLGSTHIFWRCDGETETGVYSNVCVFLFLFFLMGCMMFNKPLFFRGTIQYNLIYNNQANNLTNPEMSIGKLSKLRFDPPLIAIFPHPPRQHLHAKLSSPWVPGWTSPVSNMPTTWTKDEFHFNVKWVCLKMVVYP